MFLPVILPEIKIHTAIIMYLQEPMQVLILLKQTIMFLQGGLQDILTV